jgi:AmiR/NasT family two-component response regulator
MRVASIVSGLFFKAKIDAAVKNVGEHVNCADIAQLREHNPKLILVDLEHPQALDVLREFGNSVVAFGPHMRAELLAIAREFGAQAYPRSVFFSELGNILRQHE